MEKPILIGAAPPCAKAAGEPKAWEKAGVITAALMAVLSWRRVMRWVMFSSSKLLISNRYTLAGRPRGPAVSGASMPCFDRPEKGAAGGAAICPMGDAKIATCEPALSDLAISEHIAIPK
jgi:hypothetical protein